MPATLELVAAAALLGAVAVDRIELVIAAVPLLLFLVRAGARLDAAGKACPAGMSWGVKLRFLGIAYRSKRSGKRQSPAGVAPRLAASIRADY